MKTVRAKDAAVMIASGAAKKRDFEKIGNTGLYRYQKGGVDTQTPEKRKADARIVKKSKRKNAARNRRDAAAPIPDEAIARDIPVLLAARTPKKARDIAEALYGPNYDVNSSAPLRARITRLVKMRYLSQSHQPDYLDRYYQTSKNGLALIKQIEAVVFAAHGLPLDPG